MVWGWWVGEAAEAVESARARAARVGGRPPTPCPIFFPLSFSQRAFPGTVVTYQDLGDFTNQISVIAVPTPAASVKDLGTPEQTLDALKYVLGDSTAFTGSTRSEGGFQADKIAKASILEIKEYEKGGKAYLQFHVLTRTADGDEGGRHNLITVAVSTAGLLTLQHVVVGDKRWFKGASVGAQGSADSFTVV